MRNAPAKRGVLVRLGETHEESTALKHADIKKAELPAPALLEFQCLFIAKVFLHRHESLSS